LRIAVLPIGSVDSSILEDLRFNLSEVRARLRYLSKGMIYGVVLASSNSRALTLHPF
jgi:hypothetical protein